MLIVAAEASGSVDLAWLLRQPREAISEAVCNLPENPVIKPAACLSRLDTHAFPLAITVAVATEEMKRDPLVLFNPGRQGVKCCNVDHRSCFIFASAGAR